MDIYLKIFDELLLEKVEENEKIIESESVRKNHDLCLVTIALEDLDHIKYPYSSNIIRDEEYINLENIVKDKTGTNGEIVGRCDCIIDKKTGEKCRWYLVEIDPNDPNNTVDILLPETEIQEKYVFKLPTMIFPCIEISAMFTSYMDKDGTFYSQDKDNYVDNRPTYFIDGKLAYDYLVASITEERYAEAKKITDRLDELIAEGNRAYIYISY